MRMNGLTHQWVLGLLGAVASSAVIAASSGQDSARETIAAQAKILEPSLLETRRDIHAHPELGNTETRTAELVAKQLRELGLEVKTGVARTGVVAATPFKKRSSWPVVASHSVSPPTPGTITVSMMRRYCATVCGDREDCAISATHTSASAATRMDGVMRSPAAAIRCEKVRSGARRAAVALVLVASSCRVLPVRSR